MTVDCYFRENLGVKPFEPQLQPKIYRITEKYSIIIPQAEKEVVNSRLKKGINLNRVSFRLISLTKPPK